MSQPDITGFVTSLRAGNNGLLKDMLKADPSLAWASNEEGVSLLMLCAYHRNTEMAAIILSLRPPQDIHEAAATGNMEKLRLLVHLKPDCINSNYADGFTPLGLSVYFGHEEAARWLITAGADVNQASANAFRVIPLHSAAATGNLELLKLLLDHGAQVNAKQSSGITALHSAARNGKLDMASLLADAGADIHALTDQGKTAFDMAIEAGYEHVANYLQRKGKKKSKTHKR